MTSLRVFLLCLLSLVAFFVATALVVNPFAGKWNPYLGVLFLAAMPYFSTLILEVGRKP